MTPEQSPEISQAEMAAQVAAVTHGAFAEQMDEEYTTAVVADPNASAMDKFGEWYALGAFAETAEAARELYDKYAAEWQATVHTLVQRQVETTLYHEVHAKNDENDGVVTSLKSRKKKTFGGTQAQTSYQKAA